MEVKMDPEETAKELGPAADAPIGPNIGIASIALNMAMKYHDINTIQDGALYQQYKLEGRNIPALHLDMVFETAIQIERHLIGANKRVTEVLLTMLAEIGVAEAPAADDQALIPGDLAPDAKR
jgi:hypothetical protein